MSEQAEEIWKVIPTLESYCINQCGTVKALPKIREGRLDNLKNHIGTRNKSQRHYQERIIKPVIKANYLYVSLMHNNIKKSYRVHRLVFMAFKGNIPDNMVIDHIDGNKLNNHIDNLRCVTLSENCLNPNTRYNKDICKRVLQLDINTKEVLNEFKSPTEAECALNTNYVVGATTHIGECCRGKRRSAYGFLWQYKDNFERGIQTFKPSWSRAVLQYDLDNNLVNSYSSIREAAITNNLSSSCIQKCASGKYKQYKNYIWKYKENH